MKLILNTTNTIFTHYKSRGAMKKFEDPILRRAPIKVVTSYGGYVKSSVLAVMNIKGSGY